MNGFVYLAGAILVETIATSALKLSEGFTRLVPSLVVVIGYAAAFYLMSQALKLNIPVGTAYAIWSGVGTALITIIGIVLFQEAFTLGRLAGIALIITGVLVLNLTGGTAH